MSRSRRWEQIFGLFDRNLSFHPVTQFLSLHEPPSSCFCADAYEQSGLQEVQLEDGSTAYIQHTMHMPQSNTILAIQADGTIADLQGEATSIDPETINVLEQYTTKVILRDMFSQCLVLCVFLV